jgi:hypothetical protein
VIIQDVGKARTEIARNRVRSGDSVSAFADCLLPKASAKRISQNQESASIPLSQRWEGGAASRTVVNRFACRSTAAVQ